MLGLSSKNSNKTIALWLRQEKLVKVVPPGCKKAIGVTRDSILRLINR